MQKKTLKIIVDTREQDEFKFEKDRLDNDIIIYKDKLDAGDYSLCGYDMPGDDHSIIIEKKKNCLELAGNLGNNFERFKNEAIKLSKYKNKIILVCGNNNFDWLYETHKSALHPEFAMRQISELYVLYNIPTIFIGSKEKAESFVIRLFKRVLSQND